jgi:hypothetical protein
MSNNIEFPYPELKQLLHLDWFDLEGIRDILGLSHGANEWIKTAMQKLVAEELVENASEISWRWVSTKAKEEFASRYL